MNNNFLDMCVLDWGKLFARQSETYHWRNIVSDVQTFEADLLRHLGRDVSAFEDQIKTMFSYRAKHVAHQDWNRTGTYPTLDVAKKAVWFYHAHIVNHEAQPGDLLQLPVDIERGYDYEKQATRAVYRRIG